MTVKEMDDALGGLLGKTTSVSVLGVDTNVLVRFLAEDDPLQTPQAIQLLTDPANHPVYLAQVAIIETFWVSLPGSRSFRDRRYLQHFGSFC